MLLADNQYILAAWDTQATMDETQSHDCFTKDGFCNRTVDSDHFIRMLIEASSEPVQELLSFPGPYHSYLD